MEKNCGSCRYFVGDGRKDVTGTDGRCHRFPPSWITDKSGYKFPRTWRSEFCGEWTRLPLEWQKDKDCKAELYKSIYGGVSHPPVSEEVFLEGTIRPTGDGGELIHTIVGDFWVKLPGSSYKGVGL